MNTHRPPSRLHWAQHLLDDIEPSVPDMNRRDALWRTAAMPLAGCALIGCGGGNGAVEAATGPTTEPLRRRIKPPAPSDTPTTVTPPMPSVGRYRFNQTNLLQGSSAKVIQSRVSGGSDFAWDFYGPTYQFVDAHSGWYWSRPGGDWLDADGVRWGSKPWASILTDQAFGSSAVYTYEMDVTKLAQQVQATSRWFSLLLTSPNAPRTLAGTQHATEKPPSVVVTYTSGKVATLAPRVVAINSKSSTLPATAVANVPLPAFVEFERPSEAVASAKMVFTVVEHWSGSPPSVQAFLLDPPVNQDPPIQGLAATAGLLDANITARPEVIGAHRYTDGSSFTDFAVPGAFSVSSEANYDPAIFGTGPSDLSKLPHRGLGKWINTDGNWALVDSNYSGEGFQPLAPGLGAMKLKMPATPGVTDGSNVGMYGTLAANGVIFLPEPLFGRLGRIFVRFYVRLGTPYVAAPAKRFQVYSSGSTLAWTDFSGKFGIAPDHSTSVGGVSGSSGGGCGWQMRHSWYDCDAATGGPDEGGVAPGFHLWDFLYNNPPGYNYGKESTLSERWGQRGGVGSVLYAGHWYCVETELKLNTVMTNAPGYLPDGELRTWVDGKLAYERSGMVFRTLPLYSTPYSDYGVRPCRELGVRNLWLDWFHGGKTVNTFDRTLFYTGLVWSQQYIGPMRLA